MLAHGWLTERIILTFTYDFHRNIPSEHSAQIIHETVSLYLKTSNVKIF